MRRTLTVPLLITLAVVAGGCSGGPTFEYTVDWSARDSSSVPVRLDATGLTGDTLALEAFAAQTVLRLSSVRSATPGDADSVELHEIRDADTGREFAHLRLPVRDGRASVEYRVGVGVRDGNPHMGYSGRSFGGIGDDFAFAAGSGLFLMPEDTKDMRRVRVRFRLPPRWVAATPWAADGDGFRPGIRGRFVAEELVSAALGFGRFEERTRERAGTRFRWFVAAGLPDSARARVFAALDSVAATAIDWFGRGPGPTYTVVAVPETRDGDEIEHHGWATGHGGTLWPLTASRAHLVASDLIDAYLAYAPFRTVIRDRQQRWLGDGVRRLAAWHAVARTGLVTTDEVMRALAFDWVNALDDAHVGWNLEAAYDGTALPHGSAETVAPFSAAALDRELRAASQGADSLPGLARRVYSGRVARSLWSELPSPRDARWSRFRDRYTRGKQPPVDDPTFTLAPTALAPLPPRGAVRERLTIAFTGNTYGYLENCGCKINQAGGMPRRRTQLQRLRALGAPMAVLDAGNAFPRPERPGVPGFLAREEQGLYFRLMREMGYGAAAVNEAELAYGPDYFRAQVPRDIPFVAANVRVEGRPLAPAWTSVRAGTTRLGVIGVYEPARGPRANAVFERRARDYTVDDPVEAVARALPEVRRTSDLVVAMGRLSPYTVRRLVAACPDLDLVLSTAPEAANRYEEEDEAPTLQAEDQAGFIGRTLVLYTFLASYGLSSVQLGLDADRRIASARSFDHWLDDTVRNDPRVRAELTAFYERVGRAEASVASVPPLFADDHERMTGTYVGAAACASCHASQSQQWKGTPHAAAWQTLLDAHRHYQPRCVSCHVVGFGTPTGYALGDADPRLVNVQCEVCHGPGGEHVRAPRAANIRRAVPERVCLECHDEEHSDDFDYASKLPLVVHTSTGAAAPATGTGAGH